MSQTAFELVREAPLAGLKIDYREYRHQPTGARHIHLASEDNNNTFLVAFRTIPTDSTGVAHILEHTSLCGSRRYPVRDPFFMMYRRSLSTFMNAFTSCDWTAYPFASQSEKDFNNLLQVYLDAAFFPLLNELDFAQEGYRLEFESSDDPHSPLVYKGVVFNEMKGAMSSPERRIWQSLQSALFTNNTYHFNSGGEPENIPDLSYRQLRDFHARYYHPSNALFMTHGHLPAEKHQQQFEELALQHFSALNVSREIEDAERFAKPRRIDTRYALDGGVDTKEKTHIVIGWLLNPVTDLETTFDAHVLSSVLLDNSASPLQQALETTDLGRAPSELCGLDDDFKEALFVCGLEGSEADRADAVESMITQVLTEVAERGVPREKLESVLHQLELSQREIKGGHMPYGLQLMLRALGQTLHGGDPVAAIDIDPLLKRLGEKISRRDYVPNLVRQMLLDNPHRVLLVASPDPQLSQAEAASQQQVLQAIKDRLSEDDQRQIVEQSRALKERQESPDNADILPCVTIKDAPKDLPIPESRSSNEGIDLAQYHATTNGLVYRQLVVPVPALGDELMADLALYCECLPEVGSAGRDYLHTQERQAAVCGGIHARLSLKNGLGENRRPGLYFLLAEKALRRNSEQSSELLQETFLTPRFDELERLRELVSQIKAEREASVTDHGHGLAMMAAAAGFGAGPYWRHRWDGLQGVQALIRLDKALADENHLKALAQRFDAIRQALTATPRRLLLVAESEEQDALSADLRDRWSTVPSTDGNQAAALPAPAAITHQAWVTSTQVNFCAKVYDTVPADHRDAPALMVLGYFLRNGHLHRRIREQGGAYGGGAAYAGDSGLFQFYSYRDPRLLATLDDFDNALDWLQDQSNEPEKLEEAILGAISDIDRPDTPARQAIGSYELALHGRSPAFRRRFRERVLAVTIDDLQQGASRHLHRERGHVAVITDDESYVQQLGEHPQVFHRFDLNP